MLSKTAIVFIFVLAKCMVDSSKIRLQKFYNFKKILVSTLECSYNKSLDVFLHVYRMSWGLILAGLILHG